MHKTTKLVTVIGLIFCLLLVTACSDRTSQPMVSGNGSNTQAGTDVQNTSNPPSPTTSVSPAPSGQPSNSAQTSSPATTTPHSTATATTPAANNTPSTNPTDTTTPTANPTDTIIPSSTPLPTEQYDLVLIGSEMEGLYMARAAADEGLSVKIIDTRQDFGGQLLQGQMLFLDEAKDGTGKSLLQGRVKELFMGFKGGTIRKLSEFEQYVDEKLTGNIPVESGIRIESIDTVVESNGLETVKSITYSDGSGSSKIIQADYFVENTDHGALSSQLKAACLPSSNSFYGGKEIEYMSAGLMMKFKNVDWEKFSKHFNGLSKEEKTSKYGGGYVNETFAIGLTGMSRRYESSHERVFLRGLNGLYQGDGEVIINALLVYDVDPADPKSIAEAVELGSKELPGILEHFRKSIVGWEKAELNGIPTYPYIREYNRYETEYVLKPSDMLGGKMHWDNVSIAGYPLDLQGVSYAKWGIEMGRPDKYGMPLRAFQLKNYSNVLTAGKNVGANVVAYGSARIQPNTALAAESIGVILGQIEGKKQLRELNEADMKELHKYLAEKYKIKLTDVTGTNKLLNWSEEEIVQLDAGKIVFTTYTPKNNK